jgi:hypothetical protein
MHLVLYKSSQIFPLFFLEPKPQIEKYLSTLELDDFMLSNTSANLLNKGNLITFLIQFYPSDFIW